MERLISLVESPETLNPSTTNAQKISPPPFRTALQFDELLTPDQKGPSASLFRQEAPETLLSSPNTSCLVNRNLVTLEVSAGIGVSGDRLGIEHTNT